MKHKTSQIQSLMEEIFKDPKHPDYFLKDIELASKFQASRHSIYKVRDILKILPRKERIAEVLKNMDTASMTLKELAEKLSIKYQNLYKLVEEFNIPYKARQGKPIP